MLRKHQHGSTRLQGLYQCLVWEIRLILGNGTRLELHLVIYPDSVFWPPFSLLIIVIVYSVTFLLIEAAAVKPAVATTSTAAPSHAPGESPKVAPAKSIPVASTTTAATAAAVVPNSPSPPPFNLAAGISTSFFLLLCFDFLYEIQTLITKQLCVVP
jgi:hypothetical protein